MRKPMRPEMRPEMRPDIRPPLRPPLRPLTDDEGEVRELTEEDFVGMRPIAEVDPGMLKAVAEWRNKGGRPKAAAPKEHIGFRLSADVVEAIRASGKGYNARVDKALRATFLRTSTLAKRIVVKGAKLSSKAATSASKREAAAKSTASRKHAAKRARAQRGA